MVNTYIALMQNNITHTIIYVFNTAHPKYD